MMVACGRGVAALPRWLVEERSARLDVFPIKLGPQGVAKQIFLGFREEDSEISYLHAFVDPARSHRDSPKRTR